MLDGKNCSPPIAEVMLDGKICHHLAIGTISYKCFVKSGLRRPPSIQCDTAFAKICQNGQTNQHKGKLYLILCK